MKLRKNYYINDYVIPGIEKIAASKDWTLTFTVNKILSEYILKKLGKKWTKENSKNLKTLATQSSSK